MVDSNTLFYLILTALVLITTCLFIIVYLMITDEKEKSKLETGESKATQKCLHFFGYLADEHPRNQPIPDECFRCHLALECIDKNTEVKQAKVVEAQV